MEMAEHTTPANKAHTTTEEKTWLAIAIRMSNAAD